MTDGEAPDARVEAEGPGVALRAARVAQNLSLGEVARQLRLSVAQVEALEANRFERLPGPVFVRGFIRNYARLLKLDAELLLRSMMPPAPPQDEASVTPVARGEALPGAHASRWPRYAIAAAIVVLALAAYEFILTESPQVGVTHAPVVVPITPPPAAAPAASGTAATSVERTGVDDQARSASDVPARVDSSAAAVGSEPRADQGAATIAEIRMSFERDSWVEIRDRSGQTIFSQLNRGGSEQHVRGAPPLAVVIGNVRGMRLTYNDRPIDLNPYAKHDVARLTLE